MGFNKLISFTIVYILLAVYVSYSSFTLYQLRKTNEYLTQMAEYQANLLEQTNEDVQPMKVFGSLANNRSFSCSVGLSVAP